MPGTEESPVAQALLPIRRGPPERYFGPGNEGLCAPDEAASIDCDARQQSRSRPPDRGRADAASSPYLRTASDAEQPLIATRPAGSSSIGSTAVGLSRFDCISSGRSISRYAT